MCAVSYQLKIEMYFDFLTCFNAKGRQAHKKGGQKLIFNTKHIKIAFKLVFSSIYATNYTFSCITSCLLYKI